MVQPSRLILLGYWDAEGVSQQWPRPEDFVDSDWDLEERDLVADYLGRGFVARSYMGLSRCRMCDAQNGALELTDGVYVWPEGLAHYVRDHAVRPPDRFVGHAVRSTEAWESADRDEDWWGSIRNVPAATPGASD
jgi:hypothetical protein